MDRNDLTAESAENTESEKREMNNSNTNEFDIISEYTEWQSTEWQDYSLTQLFYEDDEIEYSLEDAQEIYQINQFKST
ncbi:MAG: hypothetical protein EAZ60_25655 [Oscillatoriales cyanobacterium]|uniref:hypothetical protein n=2 Tax=Microcoleus TaxID=44471 RepID=UPI001D64B795|nr:hypothetical protein [Microcoleus sp. PH2017_09_SFU_O_A]MCC3553775.1 hypothetical protein [Microcoleus sp. PH2017_35_SFW_U_B]TAE10802.1 MAG: hypothetical protein EAZ94_17670 [Oscillatoriales cyanobacterium]TAE22435.1 MAG: hypothetical protein EAZ93_18035 [Oscillatoriales cyanobacterium]TAE41890.1 MAG: hypothetical protein EAZ90_17040 [Oscillatoriales cyanobacterium]TAE51795.1 MAG: hypothetical protein EAZ88_17255 [Oscillatoriales cyanobacterium]